MEVFVLSYSSIIKGESITTIEGVYSSSNQVNEVIDKIITDIENEYKNMFNLDICKYNGGIENDCPCACIVELNEFPELEIHLQSDKFIVK